MDPIKPRKLRERELLESLGKHFRHLRLARNISQEALASDSGVGLSTLKRLENGRGCNLAALIQLMAALGCDDRFESFFAQLASDAAEGDPADSRRRASSPRKPAAD